MSLVYREGTTIVDQQTGGSGVGLAGGGLGVGVFSAHTTGQHSTLLARDLAPPQAMKLSGWAALGLVTGLVLYFVGLANPGAGILFGVVLAIPCARYLWRQSLWNQTELPKLKRQWESSFMCSRCGTVFAPEGGSVEPGARKPAIHDLSRGTLVAMGVAALVGIGIGSVNGGSEPSGDGAAISSEKRQADSAAAMRLLTMFRVPANRTSANLFRFEDLVHGSHLSIAHDSLHTRAVTKHLDSAQALLRATNQGWGRITGARAQINAAYVPLTPTQQDQRTELVHMVLHQDSLARRARRADANVALSQRAPVPPPAAAGSRSPIGLSLVQATRGLPVQLKRGSNVDGLPRWIGTQHLVVVEVIGDSSNISSVTLMLGMAADDGGASAAEATTFATQLVQNCAPDWSEGPDWARKGIPTAKSSPLATVHGTRRFRMKPTLGMVLFTVEHS